MLGHLLVCHHVLVSFSGFVLLSRVIPCAFVCFMNILVPESILSPGEILTNTGSGIKTRGHIGFHIAECFSVDGL